MALYDEFDSDYDDDLAADFMPLPVGYQPGMNLSLSSMQQCQTNFSNDDSSKDSEATATAFQAKLCKPGISSDDKLADYDRNQHFQRIQGLWRTHQGKVNGEIRNSLKVLYDLSGDPYLSAIFIIASCPESKKSGTKTLPYLVMESLENWLEDFKQLNGILPALSDQTVLEAVWAVSGQKTLALVEKVVNIYGVSRNAERYIDVVKALASETEYGSACRLALALNLFTQFKKEEFVLPLFIQNRLSLAESYLANNATMQKEVLQFFDTHLHYPRDMICELQKGIDIPDIKYEMLNTKSMANLIRRLMVRYNLSEDVCPKAALRQRMSSLRYLIHERYEKKAIGLENWEELIAAAVKESVGLQVELINCLCQYDDRNSAVQWARRLAIPRAELPFHFHATLDENVQNFQSGAVHVNTWDVQSTETKRFYQVPLKDKIKLITSSEEFDGFLEYVSSVDVVGLDAEWQPFSRTLHTAAILQVATKDIVFIVDIHNLGDGNFDAQQGKRFLDSLFENRSILKLGFGMREDVAVLARSLPGLESLTQSLVNALDILTLWTHIKRNHATMLPSDLTEDPSCKGLSGVVKTLFGAPLDKREQYSDWQRRPLRDSQLIYAAHDAFSLLQIFDYLRERAAATGIDWNEIINKTLRDGQPQKSSKPKHNRRVKSAPTELLPQVALFDLGKRNQSVSPSKSSDYRFVCDTMLHRVGKLLRSCGVDTVLAQNDNESMSDACVRIALDEGRIGLSKGKPFVKLCKYVGNDGCLCVESDRPELQIRQVLDHFNIRIEENDIFTRCQICNSNSFHCLHQHELLQLRPALSIPEESRFSTASHTPNDGRTWNIVKTPENAQQTCMTSSGVEMQLSSVPEGVITAHEFFYVCVGCGKCYWGGSHMQKVLSGSLKYVLDYSPAEELGSCCEGLAEPTKLS